MIRAILLDLDDTLIGNPTEPFARGFLAAWEAFAQTRLGRRGTGRQVFEAVQAATNNLDPTLSNLDVAAALMAEQWSQHGDTVLALFDTFYAEVFPRLQSLVTPRSAAPSLVEALYSAGYQVVIATNPLYGPEAIVQRLTWGRLPADLNEYAFVTHIGNMHFAKPQPYYYEEILGRLGVNNDEALMVGDDWGNDIHPAEQAGLNTFWIRQDGTPRGPQPSTPDGEGTLNDFALKVCNQGWLDTLQPRPLRPAMIAPRLTGNVAALFGLLAEVNPDHWTVRPDPNEWSPLEVVCHLGQSERLVQRPRLQRIAAEDNPFIAAPQAPPGPGEYACAGQDHAASARVFYQERRQTLDFLAARVDQDWQRPARHSIFGPTTLLEMADFTARHDRLHLSQICQTVGRCS